MDLYNWLFNTSKDGDSLLPLIRAARTCLCVGWWEGSFFCKHLQINQLIKVKISIFWSKLHVWIKIYVEKLEPRYPEKWAPHYSLNHMEAEDCFAATCMVENQNLKNDLGQEDSLNSKAETTKTQHIYWTTHPQAVTSVCDKHTRTKLCWFSLLKFSCTGWSEDSSNNITSEKIL